MAKCDHCNQDMADRKACRAVPVVSKGVTKDQIPYQSETRFGPTKFEQKHCPDCYTPEGGFHHPGCDIEECPHCHRQLIGCGCENTSLEVN